MQKAFVLKFSVLLLPLLLAETSPGDSSCRALWLFNVPCVAPNHALVRQVHAWSSRRCADEQEKCMYKIITTSLTNLEVMHTSRDLNRTTLMYFDFYPPENPNFCKIWAYSVTSPFNTKGTNEFCLFHNLFQGSGLTDAQGYREITNERMCPSVSSATCLQGDQLSAMEQNLRKGFA